MGGVVEQLTDLKIVKMSAAIQPRSKFRHTYGLMMTSFPRPSGAAEVEDPCGNPSSTRHGGGGESYEQGFAKPQTQEMDQRDSGRSCAKVCNQERTLHPSIYRGRAAAPWRRGCGSLIGCPLSSPSSISIKRGVTNGGTFTHEFKVGLLVQLNKIDQFLFFYFRICQLH